MAFSPVSLPIQEILLTDFVTDIASISNANDLLLQDKLEDLLNNLEIDLTTLSIGTDNPINYIRANSVILQDTGFTFQTGSPLQIIAKLEKNISNQSVLTIDKLQVNADIDVADILATNIVASDSLTSNGPSVANDTFQFNSAIIESKETIVADLVKTVAKAEARITLTSGSKKNIFVKLKATSAPNLNYVYDGVSAIEGSITEFDLFIDFDLSSPPAQNTSFNIYLVDIVEEISLTSIVAAVNSGLIPVYIKGGINLNAGPSVPVYMHNLDLVSPTYNLGINPSSVNTASLILKSNAVTPYGHNIGLTYILDENTKDRLVVTSIVGMEFF